MKIINGSEFDEYWKSCSQRSEDETAENSVKEIIKAVRKEGDSAVRRYTSMFDKSSPETLEVPLQKIKDAIVDLEKTEPDLAKALRFSAENIKRFSMKQREQFQDFEFENLPGIFTGQKIIPIETAGVYVPGGRYPLVSSALMCLIPAFCAGVNMVCFSSPPCADGFPDKRILAAAGIAVETCGVLSAGSSGSTFRSFAIGGAQAIAALALGTSTIPRCDIVAGPGNKFVAIAKRLLFGETGIDFIAGPSDILVITDKDSCLDIAAADMLAQAEHDPDARARALVPDKKMAADLSDALQTCTDITRSSLEEGGLIIIYENKNEAQRIANEIAPEHRELHVTDPGTWVSGFKNYGSLFIGDLSAEVLGDYSSGLSHILPTSGCARFTGGYSVRHFLKTVTCLRCEKKAGYPAVLDAARTIGQAEGLELHAESAVIRMNL